MNGPNNPLMLPRKRTWMNNPGLGWGWWKGFVMLECPFGHRNRYKIGPDGHQIAADGAVTPSTVCPGDAKPCTFHEYVRFLDFGPAENVEEKD